MENNYIQFFNQRNLTITEQTQTKNNPLFKLTYDIQLHQASMWFPTARPPIDTWL